MKKILCLILSVILVFSLVACNNSKTENPTEDDVQIETPGEDEYVPEEQNFDLSTVWTLKDDVSLGDLSLTKETIVVNEENIEAYTTEIASINEDDLLKQLNESAHFSCNGEKKYYPTRDEHHRLNHIGRDNHVAIITNRTSLDNGSSDKVYMSVNWEQTKYHDATPNTLSIYYRAETAMFSQAELYNLMKQLAPNIAEYAVYGKDPESEDPYQFNTRYNGDKYSYSIKREVSGDEYECTVTFHIYIYNEQQDFFNNTLRDETQCFDEPGVKFSDMLAENVPNLSPTDASYKDFAEQALRQLFPNYAYANITNWYHVDKVYTNENVLYDRAVEVSIFDKDGMSVANFEYFIRQTPQADGSTEFSIVEFRILSYDAWEKGNATNEKFKTAMTSILKDFTVGEMSIDENNSNKYVGDAKMKVGDQEISGYFAIETDSATRMTIYLS